MDPEEKRNRITFVRCFGPEFKSGLELVFPGFSTETELNKKSKIN